MRDYERLEELSKTVSAGLAAGEVVLAVDRLLAGASLDADGRVAVAAGVNLLRQLADPEAEFGSVTRGTQSLMSTGTAVDALELVHLQAPPDVAQFLNELATALEEASESTAPSPRAPLLEEVLKLFSLLGDVELARSNRIARAGQEPMRWRSSTTTSRS
jgi:hypothetical protein